MKRKSIISSIVIAGMGIVSSASALPVQHAVDFHAANPADEASLVKSVNGVANGAPTSKDIIGTIARDPQDVFGGARVTVVGFNNDGGPGGVTTSCTVYAVTPPLSDEQIGNTIVSKSFSVNQNHTWTRTTQFNASEVGAKSSFFIRCTLPGNQKARILSVRIPSTDEPGGAVEAPAI